MLKPLLKLKRSVKRLLKVKREIDPTISHRRSRILVKYLLAAVSILLITLLYPASDLRSPIDIPRLGEISHENIIADFSFSIHKDGAQLAEERKLAAQSTPLYIDYGDEVAENVLADLRRLPVAAASLLSAGNDLPFDSIVARLKLDYPFLSNVWLRKVLETDSLEQMIAVIDTILGDDVYYYGVINDTASLPSPEYKSIVIRKKRRELLMVRNQLIDQHRAYNILIDRLNELNNENGIDVDFYYEIGRHFILPNSSYDMLATRVARDSAVRAISSIESNVTRSDLLVRRGEKVDAAKERILNAYAGEMQKQAAARGWWHATIPVISRLILVSSIIILIFLFLYHFRPDVFWSNNKLLALFIIIGLELFLVNFIGFPLIPSVYLYPIAILSILITVLFDARLGVFITLLVALLLGILNRFDFTITLITALAGLAACFSAGEIRRRSEFYRIIIFVSMAYVIITLAVESIKLSPAADLVALCGYGLINGFISPVLTIGILPMFESLFGFSTNITLLELADLNHPLLKQLSISAPGTYHHSIVVGTLAEAAAKDIGANPLLARVGSYYHDIGKMEIPEYFVENQLGIKSKHEALNPTMSALVIASHVKKGRRMGEEAGLPDDVLNFVEEHHGTTTMTYFYNKAMEMDLPISSDQEFRYPGPKPQTKETAIVMLADSTEAASRTLDNPTSARIRNLIQKLINDKFGSGELTECPLTLKDLTDIREAFVSILIGVFHRRIAYPKKRDEKRSDG